MDNAELIRMVKAAERYINYFAPRCYASIEAEKAILAAADALEAADKRIAEQQKQIAQLYLLLNNRINEIAELEAQMPKEGEWIDMGDFEMCSVCKIAQRKKYRQYYDGFMWVRTDFCPKCGSRMRKG